MTEAEKTPAGITRGEWLGLAAILTLGLCLRLWFLAQILHAPDFRAPQQDPEVLDYYARALLSGDWTVRAGETDPEIGTTPYFRPPGYAFYLLPIYALTNGSYLAPRLVQMTLGLCSALLLFLIGRKLFGRAAGLAAAFFMATYWGLIFWEGELNDPSLFVFMLSALLYILLRWTDTLNARWAALAGLIFGCYALMRPNILAFGPVVALWMLWWSARNGRVRRIVASWCALAGITLLVVLPITIRNYVVSGEFVPIATYFGENLMIGNSEDSDGITPWTPYLQQLEGTGR